MTNAPAPHVIVALDFPAAQLAREFVKQLDPKLCRLKVGKTLFTSAGPQFVEELIELGFAVFLDLKFHDIPNTVAGACKAAAQLGVWMMNIHVQGGRRMMEAAVNELHKLPDNQRPILTGVTVLTSLANEDLQELGYSQPAKELVLQFATLAKQSGLDGVVCSSQEAALLRAQLGPDFVLVSPGIRPQGCDQQDQRRVMTPEQAMAAGVDYMVIGRPITQAVSPKAVLESIA